MVAARPIALVVAAILLSAAAGTAASASDCSALARELKKDEKALAEANKRLVAHRKKGLTTGDAITKEEVLKSAVALEQGHVRDTQARMRKAGC